HELALVDVERDAVEGEGVGSGGAVHLGHALDVDRFHADTVDFLSAFRTSLRATTSTRPLRLEFLSSPTVSASVASLRSVPASGSHVKVRFFHAAAITALLRPLPVSWVMAWLAACWAS